MCINAELTRVLINPPNTMECCSIRIMSCLLAVLLIVGSYHS